MSSPAGQDGRDQSSAFRAGRIQNILVVCVTLCYRRQSEIPEVLADLVMIVLVCCVQPINMVSDEGKPSFIRKKISPFKKENHQLKKKKIPSVLITS